MDADREVIMNFTREELLEALNAQGMVVSGPDDYLRDRLLDHCVRMQALSRN